MKYFIINSLCVFHKHVIFLTLYTWSVWVCREWWEGTLNKCCVMWTRIKQVWFSALASTRGETGFWPESLIYYVHLFFLPNESLESVENPLSCCVFEETDYSSSCRRISKTDCWYDQLWYDRKVQDAFKYWFCVTCTITIQKFGSVRYWKLYSARMHSIV